MNTRFSYFGDCATDLLGTTMWEMLHEIHIYYNLIGGIMYQTYSVDLIHTYKR